VKAMREWLTVVAGLDGGIIAVGQPAALRFYRGGDASLYFGV
jgi:hypothetical protein